MVFTDAPYNVKIDGHASGLGATRHPDFAMASGEMDEVEFTDFLTRSCQLMARHSIDGAIHFLCMDWRHIGEMLTAGRQVYSNLKNVCIWVKHNAGMGSLYRSQDLGKTWKRFDHGVKAHSTMMSVGLHPRDPNQVYCATRGGQVFGTQDGGANWHEYRLPENIQDVYTVACA